MTLHWSRSPLPPCHPRERGDPESQRVHVSRIAARALSCRAPYDPSMPACAGMPTLELEPTVIPKVRPPRVRRLSKTRQARVKARNRSFQSPQKPLPFLSISIPFFPRIETYQSVARAAGPEKNSWAPLPGQAVNGAWRRRARDDRKASRAFAFDKPFVVSLANAPRRSLGPLAQGLIAGRIRSSSASASD